MLNRKKICSFGIKPIARIFRLVCHGISNRCGKLVFSAKDSKLCVNVDKPVMAGPIIGTFLKRSRMVVKGLDKLTNISK